jgi:diguanylate cyclase (GGDEF)-like protein/PAS domain S-box-containing protein
MPAAAIPADEALRLARLQALAVLDTDAEPLFDALTWAAAAVTGRPIALISLIDADRQWFKSNIGLSGVSETPRDSAFCAHTILGTDLMEVADAQQDARFADNPLVTGKPDIRFYAGAPITLGDGLCMGSLCVIDREPGSLDEHQRETLMALASAVAEALELRRYGLEKRVALEHEAEALRWQMESGRLLEQDLRAKKAFLNRTGRLAGVGGWELDLATRRVTWSDETCRIHDLPPGYEPSLEEAVNFYAPEARSLVQSALEKAIAGGEGWDLQLPLITATGRNIWVRAVGAVEYADDGQPCRVAGAFQDVTLRKRAVAALEASDRRYRKLFQYSLGLICTHDREGVLLSVNPAAAKSLGYSVGEMIGRPLSDFIRPELHRSFRDYLLRVITTNSDAGMLELIARDGSLHTWQYHNVLDDEGDEPYVLGHAQDVTERHQHERKLREWSIRDALTGCFNRRYLAELMAAHPEERWGCIVIDLDHFKQVNDTYGHQRGDEVLIGMATFLFGHVRSQDAVIRLGGDEFLVLLSAAGEGLTEEIVGRLDADRAAAPIAFTLGSTTLDQGTALEAGLAEADRLLYEARAGRSWRAR